MLRKAKEYGFMIFMDCHQDVVFSTGLFSTGSCAHFCF